MTDPIKSEPNQQKATEESAQEPCTEPQKNEERIQELEAKLKEQESKYLYLYADFDNFKKRTQKERLDLLKYGWEPLALDLLQIMDNLERALAHLPPTTEKSLTDGLNLVMNQFKTILKNHGIERVVSITKLFDPNLHEVVAQEHSDHPPSTILQELRGGYTLHGRLLRPARVIVSQGKPSELVENTKEK